MNPVAGRSQVCLEQVIVEDATLIIICFMSLLNSRCYMMTNKRNKQNKQKIRVIKLSPLKKKVEQWQQQQGGLESDGEASLQRKALMVHQIGPNHVCFAPIR